MTIEQIKEEAKEHFGRDLTDEQAPAWLDAHPAGELQDEELENVSGGHGGLCGGGRQEDKDSIDAVTSAAPSISALRESRR